MMNIDRWIKSGLVLWMLAHPVLYFLLVASPERGGIISMLPEIAFRLHELLIPFFMRLRLSKIRLWSLFPCQAR